MNLTETNFNQFRNDILNALAAVAEKYACEVTMGNIKYDMTSIDTTLYFKAKGDNGESAEEMDFKKYCGDYGFKSEDYNATVVVEGKRYSFIGFNPRARKNYCIIRDAAGKEYATSIALIQSSLRKVGE